MTIRCRRLPLLSTIVVLCLVITGCSGTDSPLADRALALHDPGTRTVFFPLATSAGTMPPPTANHARVLAVLRALSRTDGL